MRVLLTLFIILGAVGFSARKGWLGPEAADHLGPVFAEFLAFLLHPPSPWNMVMQTVLVALAVLLLIRVARWFRDMVL